MVVCIVSDGRQKINSRTLSVLAAMGCYQDGIAKNVVNRKEVSAHIYEYTTQSEYPRTDISFIFYLSSAIIQSDHLTSLRLASSISHDTNTLQYPSVLA